MAESDIDPTVFPDNQKVDKADLREQFTIAKDELTELLNKQTLAYRLSISDLLFDNL